MGTDKNIPTVIAVALWAATAAMVLGYTVKAYSATVSGDGGASVNPGPTADASIGIDAVGSVVAPVR